MNSKHIILGIGFVVVLIFLSGCIIPKEIWENNDPGVNTRLAPTFSTCSEIKDAFRSTQTENYGLDVLAASTPGGQLKAMMTTAMQDGSAMESSTLQRSSDYSTTNVQVEGVDEADIIKTDGRYIYALTKEKLYIVNANLASSARIVSETKLVGEPYELFIDDESVLVFSRNYEVREKNEYAGRNAAPYYQGYENEEQTTVSLYDISKPEKPKLEKQADFEGTYISSRKIGSMVYFVIRKYPRYEGGMNDAGMMLPAYREKTANRLKTEFTPTANCRQVIKLVPENARTFIVVGSISMSDYDRKIEKKTIVAGGENIYSSENNLYLAEQGIRDPIGIPMPIPMFVDAREVRTFEETTKVHKFALDDGKIAYLGSMEAPGHILNQFSMDEYNGYFRIATTRGQILRENSDSTNNMYVFDKKMDLVGALEGLAAGEKIYSARFMGKRAYLVTFKKVDPLFVIDLSNPSEPKMLGKLKIPGYSDYLHPIDENHLIGIGKDTVEADDGNFAWYQGLKMAVFDVTNVKHPKEMYKTVIGDRGTDSYALRDHKAFLYDREKNLLAIPVLLAELPEPDYEYSTEYENENGQVARKSANSYGNYVFQGAYVYDLSLEHGFDLRGRITHREENRGNVKSRYYYEGGSEYDIKRSLYIGNTLYTFSEGRLMANDLKDLHKIKEIEWN